MVNLTVNFLASSENLFRQVREIRKISKSILYWVINWRLFMDMSRFSCHLLYKYLPFALSFEFNNNLDNNVACQ